MDMAPFLNENNNYDNSVDTGEPRQIAPGSNPGQKRPGLIKRDSDIAPPRIMPMGGENYSYAPARNKK